MKKITVVLLLLLVYHPLGEASQPVQEQAPKVLETLAVATFVMGKVVYVRDQKTKALKPNTFLYQNDKVITENGKADIQIGPNSIIRLSPGSVLNLADLSESGNSQRIRLALQSGSVYAKIVKNLDKDSSFTIQTTNIVAGVRGTEFVVAEEKDPSALEQKLEDSDIPPGVFVNKGEVRVQRISDSLAEQKAILVKQGEQVLTKNQELQKQILEDFMKQKMEIFAKLDVMKQQNYEMLKKQRERDYEALQKMRQQQKETWQRFKGEEKN